MGWGSSDAPEPADEPEGVKPQVNAGTSRRKGVLPAKRDGRRRMKPNVKEKLEAPDFSRERTSHALSLIFGIKLPLSEFLGLAGLCESSPADGISVHILNRREAEKFMKSEVISSRS